MGYKKIQDWQWNGYMDGYLKKNLDVTKDIIKKDWDMIFIVDGYEGTGKSAFAQQMAKYVDPSFNIDKICFNPQEFIKAINNSDPYQAVIYDEAYQGMSSRAAMSEVNRMLVSHLAEIRQKNLFVFIILPCFFELDKYAAVWRSRGLIHVYTGKGFERGYFSFYSQGRKKDLYVNGKKFYSYKKPSPNFFGRFPKGYTVPEQEYRKKKLDALKIREEKPIDKLNRREKALANYFIGFVTRFRAEGLTWEKISSFAGVSENATSRMFEEVQKFTRPMEGKEALNSRTSTVTTPINNFESPPKPEAKIEGLNNT